jgi:hypothetical protein
MEYKFGHQTFSLSDTSSVSSSSVSPVRSDSPDSATDNFNGMSTTPPASPACTSDGAFKGITNSYSSLFNDQQLAQPYPIHSQTIPSYSDTGPPPGSYSLPHREPVSSIVSQPSNSAGSSLVTAHTVDLAAVSKLKVPQLKNLLSQYSLKRSGKKQELIERLASYIQRTGTTISTSSVITNWPRKPPREVKSTPMAATTKETDFVCDESANGMNSLLEVVLPHFSSEESGQHFDMPPPIHADSAHHSRLLFSFESSLTDEDISSFRHLDGCSTAVATLFNVFYDKKLINANECLHLVYFFSKSKISFTLVVTYYFILIVAVVEGL